MQMILHLGVSQKHEGNIAAQRLIIISVNCRHNYLQNSLAHGNSLAPVHDENMKAAQLHGV